MDKNKEIATNLPFYMKLSFRIELLIILFLILTYEVIFRWTVTIDSTVYEWLMTTFSPAFTPIFKVLTHFWWVYWIIVVTLLLTAVLSLKKGNRKYATLTLLTPVIITIINTVIKNSIQRPRPDILRLITESWYSFPSWHTMHTVALYWVIILLTSHFIKNKSLKRTIYGFSLLMMLWVTSSRIYLWVHYFSDILWWILLSLIYIFLVEFFFFRKKVA